MRPYAPSSGGTSLEELAERVAQLERILDGSVEWGDPNGIISTAGGYSAGASNDNVFGAWVEVTGISPTQAGANVTFTHNLGLASVPLTDQPVRWLVWGIQETAALPAGSIVQFRYVGGARTENSIVLKAFCNNAPAGGTVTATLFFIPVSQ